MGKRINMQGKKYGHLTAIKVEYVKYGTCYWKFACDCGNVRVFNGSTVRKGRVVSCGCAKGKHWIGKNNPKYKHGMSGTRLNSIIKNMKTRCLNPNSLDYKNYGGRGIKICDEWMKDKTTFFEWALNNGYRENLSIDRIDVNGNYEPSNCRWVTWSVQAINKRKQNPIRSIRSDNKSNIVGVYYINSGKWIASLELNHKKLLRKEFHNKQDAIDARKEAEEKYFKPILDKYKKTDSAATKPVNDK